jgi:hypothetical protein
MRKVDVRKENADRKGTDIHAHGQRGISAPSDKRKIQKMKTMNVFKGIVVLVFSIAINSCKDLGKDKSQEASNHKKGADSVTSLRSRKDSVNINQLLFPSDSIQLASAKIEQIFFQKKSEEVFLKLKNGTNHIRITRFSSNGASPEMRIISLGDSLGECIELKRNYLSLNYYCEEVAYFRIVDSEHVTELLDLPDLCMYNIDDKSIPNDALFYSIKVGKDGAYNSISLVEYLPFSSKAKKEKRKQITKYSWNPKMLKYNAVK